MKRAVAALVLISALGVLVKLAAKGERPLGRTETEVDQRIANVGQGARTADANAEAEAGLRARYPVIGSWWIGCSNATA